jgi:hypothetical protein
MTADGWREAVLMAVAQHRRGDHLLLELLVRLLVEQDEAKITLHRKGYGASDSSWPEVVALVPTEQ